MRANSILRAAPLRKLAFGSPFAALFLFAWLADKYPGLNLLLMILSFGVLLAESSLLYIASREEPTAVSAQADGLAQRKSLSSSVASSVAELRSLQPTYTHFELAGGDVTQAEVRAYMQLYMSRRRLEARLMENWARIKALDSASWDVQAHGEQAFTINAGAFEIEHFHGKTNIRILDSSSVFVEGRTRGQSIQEASDIIRPSVLH